MPLPFALDHINLWLLADGASWTPVDCGYGDAATRALWEQHFRETLSGRPIGRVIATHYHPDHLGNAAWLAARWDCSVAMPQAEYLTAHAVADERAGYGAAATAALFRRHGLSDEHIAALEVRGNSYRRGVPELPGTYERLLAGDELAIGAERWRVIPGYGHSPEHAALYCAASNVLISGDMLLPKISTNISVWPVEPGRRPAGPLPGLARRVHRACAQHAGPALAWPAFCRHPHPGRAVARAPRRAPGGAGGRRRAARSPPAQMLPVLFRRSLDLQQRYFAMGEAIAHLNHLWHEGRLVRSLQDGVLRFGRP